MMERRLRLREEWEVNETRRKGRTTALGPLVAKVRSQQQPLGHNRYAVIAGKRVGNAVQRNRCKRLVRESLRRLHPRLEQGYDIAIIIRGGVDELTSQQVAERTLRTIFSRSQLLDDSAELP